ncbi:drug/metabolite exporter YedA [Streptomyces sp. NBC_01077]|uniref:drug/metabolite exporter YedA n=1 Tax=Streptomyces sp. NBC_01077 TaxID=2903746 RepID=UPI003866547C|nr:drug/metabolite exporter YedA [Streptomyces sp. NBC_01077]
MTTQTQETSSTLGPTVVLCLASVYVVWGSTYLAIDYTLDSMPPLLMTGTRFLAGGIILAVFLLSRGHTLPTRRQWLHCALVGGLMQGGCVGGIAIAERTLSSGLASVGIATVPVWTVLMVGVATRRWPNRMEAYGILLGLVGVVLLAVDGGLGGGAKGSVVIVAAAVSWSLGSVLSQHLELPRGPMAYAGEMLAGGTLVSLVGLLAGERVDRMPDASALWAWGYLVVFGSLLAYSAYMYLLTAVRTTLATSYTLVTPAVAVLLGAWILSERVSALTVLAVAAVLIAVRFIFRGRKLHDANDTREG